MKNSLVPVEEFIARRATFIEKMANNSVAIIFAGQEVTRSNDTEYLFCQNKHFYYLTGFNEPDAVLLLIKGEQAKSQNQNQNQSILFSRAKDALQEVWHGKRIGQALAVTEYAFEQCFTLPEINDLLPSYLSNKTQLSYCFSQLGEQTDSQIQSNKRGHP